MVEMSVVLDLLPTLASLYFNNRLRAIREDEVAASAAGIIEEEEELRLSGLQSSLLLAIGLQRKTPDDIGGELRLPVQQTMALFVKTVRQLVKSLRKVEKKDIVDSMPELGGGVNARAPLRNKARAIGADSEEGEDWTALKGDLQSELKQAGRDFLADHNERTGNHENEDNTNSAGEDTEEADETLEAKRKLVDSMDLSKYAIHDSAKEGVNWSQAEEQVAQMVRKNGGTDLSGFNTTISVKGTKRVGDEDKATPSPAKSNKKPQGKTRSPKKQRR